MRHPITRGRTAKAALVAAGAIAAVAATGTALGAGEGSPLRGGTRNPSSNSSISYQGQTQIIADNSSFGTRQSNKGTGGGAIYGCRARPGGPGCLVADNIRDGLAFKFISGGNLGGTITLANRNGAPLTTNATGVATGFNANYIQGYQATQLALGATGATGATGPGAAANSVALGGVPASGYEQTGQLLFATVSQAAALGANRGVTAVSGPANGVYTVTFDANVSRCSYTASPVGAAIGGSIGVALNGSNPNAIDVNTPNTLGAGGFELQVVC